MIIPVRITNQVRQKEESTASSSSLMLPYLSDPCMPSDENRFILIAELLGLPFEDFLKALTVQTRRLPGNNVRVSSRSDSGGYDNVGSTITGITTTV